VTAGEEFAVAALRRLIALALILFVCSLAGCDGGATVGYLTWGIVGGVGALLTWEIFKPRDDAPNHDDDETPAERPGPLDHPKVKRWDR